VVYVGWLPEITNGAITLGSSLTLASGPMTPHNVAHEAAHREQARDWGWGYLPGYVWEAVLIIKEHASLDMHRYHSYEIRAEERAAQIESQAR